MNAAHLLGQRRQQHDDGRQVGRSATAELDPAEERMHDALLVRLIVRLGVRAVVRVVGERPCHRTGGEQRK